MTSKLFTSIFAYIPIELWNSSFGKVKICNVPLNVMTSPCDPGQARLRPNTRGQVPATAVTISRQRSRPGAGAVVVPTVQPKPKDQDDEEGGHTPVPSLRHASAREKAILAVLATNDLTSSMALSILAPFFPREAANKGISESVSGWVFGVFALTQFIVSPIYGKLLPKVGPRFMSFAGQFFAGGCTILFGILQFVPTTNGPTVFIVLCFILRIFQALGCAASSTASFAIAAQTFEDNPSTVFGLLETAVGFGLMIGPALGGVLFEVGGFVTPFVAIGGFLLLTLPLFMFILPPESPAMQSQEQGSIKDLLKIPPIAVASAAVVIGSMTWVILDPTLEPHLRQFNLSPSIIGIIFLLESACYAVCAPIWGWVADNVYDSTPMLMTGFLLGGVGMLLLGPSPLFGLPADFNPLWLNIVALIIFGIAMSLAIVPTYDKILDAGEKAGIDDNFGNYSAVAGLWNSMYALGEFIGPVVAGTAVTNIGFGWLTTGAACLCILMFIILLVLYIYESKCTPRYNYETKQTEPVETNHINHNVGERTPLLQNSYPSDT